MLMDKKIFHNAALKNFVYLDLRVCSDMHIFCCIIVDEFMFEQMHDVAFCHV